MGIDPRVKEFQDEVREHLEDIVAEGGDILEVTTALMCIIGSELLDAIGFNMAIEAMEEQANMVSEFMLDAATEERRLSLH